MAVEGNGKVVDGGHKGMNRHAGGPKPKRPPRSRSAVGGISNIVARLLIWYSIATIIFRCPTSRDLLTDASPKICKPYFQLKAHIAPHLEPYYESYAAPYVESVRPYYETLERKVFEPATVYSKKYGAPRIAQLKAFGRSQWEKSIQPQLGKLNTAAKSQYKQTLGPHIDKAVAAANPYYASAKDGAFQTYYTTILPSYNAVLPYAQRAYELGGDFAVNTGIPYATWAWSSAVVFLDRILWPKVRILYGENIEPQLVRIGERLGRYRDGKKLRAVLDEVDNSSVAASTSRTLASVASSISAHVSSSSSAWSSTSTSPAAPGASTTPLTEEQVVANAQQIVQHDLKKWQEKFARAADQGSDELDERIMEITDKQIQTQSKVGEAHLIELEESVTSEVAKLKKNIIKTVEQSSTMDSESVQDILTTAVRHAGITIKDKAQAVRTWRQNFDEETVTLITAAAQDVFEIIDEIRNLGLQEIGMRWAWTDGISHKDWAKYHALKRRFEEWRKDVQEIVATHPGLVRARATSEDVENRAMAIAEDTVKELATLKETGRWKIAKHDASDDFTPKTMPAAVATAGARLLTVIDLGGNKPKSQGTVESLSAIASSSISAVAAAVLSIMDDQAHAVKSIVSEASDTVSKFMGGKDAATSKGSIESVLSAGQASVENFAGRISSSVIGTSMVRLESIASGISSTACSFASQETSSSQATPGVREKISRSISSTASDTADAIRSAASNLAPAAGVPGSSEQSVLSKTVNEAFTSLSTSASSVVGEVSSAASAASDALSSSASLASSKVSSAVSENSAYGSSGLSSASSTVSKKIWGGAEAQFVQATQIVFEDVIDDDATYSEKLQSIASQAGDRFSEMTKAVSEALLQLTFTQGSVQSMTSLASDQYSRALSAASVALYGTQTGSVESLSSALSSKYAEAVTAASYAIYGTPAPVVSSLASQASAAYSNALSRASEHYSHAISMVSAQISGTPKPVHEEMFSSVQSAYSDSLDAASSRLQAAIGAASTAAYGTALSQESLLSVAKQRYSDAQNYASSQYEAAKSAISGSPKPAHESLLSAADRSYSEFLSGAHSQYSAAITTASAVLYGPPPGALESISSVASSRLSEGLIMASAQYESAKAALGATQTPVVQKYLAQAQQQYYAGIGLAHVRYSEFVEAASAAIVPTPTSFHQSLYNRASLGIVGTYTGAFESAVSVAQSKYSDAFAVASASLDSAISAATAGSQNQKIKDSLASVASSRYSQALSAASDSLASASSAASIAVYGTEPGTLDSVASMMSEGAGSVKSRVSTAMYGSETPRTESMASAASENWEALVTKASLQIYGAPTPWHESIYSQAGEYAAQATEGAAAQFIAVKSLVNELVSGKEPDFTESVYSRLQSAYYTAMPAAASSASSYASEAYASASSVVNSVFTPPPTLEIILGDVSSKVNQAVDAASAQIYGTTKGAYEQATSSAASAYSSLSSAASIAAYGSSTGYVEAASSSIADAASLAQQAILDAIYGTSTPAYPSATSALGDAYMAGTSVVAEHISPVTEAISDNYKSAQEKASTIIYGPEKGVVENAQSRLTAAVESARAKLAEFADAVGEGVSDAVKEASEGVEDFTSSVSSAVNSATSSIKDEL